MEKPKTQFFKMLGLALVVIRNKEGKYLAVLEKRNRGWWLAGGKVDPPEDFHEAAVREAKEEAGLDIELKGVLRVEYKVVDMTSQRIKIIYYAEPKDENQKPKQEPDDESEMAKWMSLEEIMALVDGSPGWRGPELYQWAKYLDAGGAIYPLSMMSPEGSEPQQVGKEGVKTIKDL